MLSSPLSFLPSLNDCMHFFLLVVSIHSMHHGASYEKGEGDAHVQAFHSSARWQLHLNSLSQTPQLTVIDFAATWCGPCKLVEPTVHALASKFPGVSFAKIDVDELSDVARECGVQAMPTFVLMKKGKEVARVVGARKEELESQVQRHHAAS